MRHVLRLLAFAAVAALIVVVVLYAFRGQALRFLGVSFDTGDPGETQLQLPAGYEAGVFASGLSGPRFMAVAADGTLLVAERGANRVVGLPDRNGDGVADEVVVVGQSYDQAHSLAVEPDGSLLVAGTAAVHRVTIGTDLRETSRSVFVTLPPDGEHNTRSLAIRPDGSILVSVGSSCNVCDESDPHRAAILLVPAEGRTSRVFMRGLRNAVGLTVDPATGTAWATNNGRDLLGDDLPPETLYHVVDGADGGWPRCHAGNVVDPDFGTHPDPVSGAVGCDGVAQPAAEFGAHMAPLGLAFWQGHAVIAFHGSWNRSSKVGYDLMWLPWADGPAGAATELASGFLDPATGDATGRPAGVTVGADGALYVSDDKAGFIYRITGP